MLGLTSPDTTQTASTVSTHLPCANINVVPFVFQEVVCDTKDTANGHFTQVPMRGCEQCSTSYATGSKCAWQQARPQCPLRHTKIRPVRLRTRTVAADSNDSLLAQWPGGQPQRPNDVMNFLHPQVSHQEAQDGSWADKVDDWAAYWEGNYLDFKDEDDELDDTYDALILRTQHADHSRSLVQALSFLFTTSHIKCCSVIQTKRDRQRGGSPSLPCQGT